MDSIVDLRLLLDAVHMLAADEQPQQLRREGLIKGKLEVDTVVLSVVGLEHGALRSLPDLHVASRSFCVSAAGQRCSAGGQEGFLCRFL
ncbi:unnamed protein product [Boreogadus saida]